MPKSDTASAMVTVTQGEGEQLISVSMRSGHEDGLTPLNAACHRYDREAGCAEAPILALYQGAVHAQVTCADRQSVSEADVATARSMAEASLAYFEAMLAARAKQQAGRG